MEIVDTLSLVVDMGMFMRQQCIQGVALQWLSSYLKDKTFSVSIGKFFSSSFPLLCGVPLGSILGTSSLFTLYATIGCYF